MTEEERQRQMDFILQSQAKSEARLDRLERVARLMVRAGLRARRQMREQGEHIAAIVDSQMHTEEIVRHNSEAIRELTEVVRQLASRPNNGGRPEGD